MRRSSKNFRCVLSANSSSTSKTSTASASSGKVVRVTADERVLRSGKPDMDLVDAIAFDPYTHGYYRVGGRVGEAFHDGLPPERLTTRVVRRFA